VSQVGVEASLQQSNQITLQCLQVVEIFSVHQEEEKNQFERSKNDPKKIVKFISEDETEDSE
jgi:hypothetical protein